LPRIGGKERHAQQIYWAMVDLLAKADYRPGTRLPNEIALAERFAVSRPTMREAIRVLEYSGLVESRQGRNGGLFVGEGAMPTVLGAIRTLFIINNRSSDNLYEARTLLEVGIARLAATKISDEQLETMADSIARSEADHSVGAVRESNRVFHMTLVEAAGNDILRAIMLALISLLNEMAPSGATMDTRLDGHRAILAALRQRDPEAAAAAMSDHLQEMADYHRTSSIASENGHR
jgi:GntR family transcriptional regulator, transcriptional repressor for pyruvate dehydrogenase complex